MTAVQPGLGLPRPTIQEAAAIRDQEMAAAWEAANAEWIKAAENEILALPRGREFLTEDIVEAIHEKGFTTSNKKAIGSLVRDMSRKGFIHPTGSGRQARTSNLALKPIWKRTRKGKK